MVLNLHVYAKFSSRYSIANSGSVFSLLAHEVELRVLKRQVQFRNKLEHLCPNKVSGSQYPALERVSLIRCSTCFPSRRN